MTVNVRAIEAELARIQRELTNSEVRTSLFNLVVFQTSATAGVADQALTYLLGKRAARVIQIRHHDGEESSIHASARCFIDAERKGVCFQEVIIGNGHDGAGAAPGSWSGLLIRDIPTFVVWLDALEARRAVLRHALELADKVIVDSELSELGAGGDDPDALLTRVRHLSDTGVLVSDFTWRRLEPLRRLTARAFDHRESLLQRIDRVQIGACSSVFAELYLRWLAERLGWRRSGRSFYDSHGTVIEIDHRLGAPGSCDLTLAFDLRKDGSSDETEAVQLSTHANGCADIDLPEEEAARRIVRFPTAGEMLLREVDSIHGDPRFAAALAH